MSATNRLQSVSSPKGLIDRRPHLDVEHILGDLTPPPHFRDASFDTFIPGDPTQEAALAALRSFAGRVDAPRSPRRGLFRRSSAPAGRAGMYLDGGFGVGKTHLLASLWKSVEGPKTYGTFVEYTNLVGLLGFRRAVEVLKNNRLVCIDEFELDDPGDTVLMSTLLGELVDSGVYLAATSNTLPEKLGEGRFAAEDFLREIQGLSAHFDVLRIDGEDYRHRGAPEAPEPCTDEQVRDATEHTEGATLDHFLDLIRFLPEVHPSQYGALVDGIPLVGLQEVRTLNDQAQALRLVVLVDRLYDRDVPVVASGVPLDALFSTQLLTSGYRKKYYRAISRIVALARQGRERIT